MNLGSVFNEVVSLSSIHALREVGKSTQADTPARRAACNVPIAMLVTELDNKLGANSPSFKLMSAAKLMRFDAADVWQRWQSCKTRLSGSARDPRFIRMLCNVLPDLAARYATADKLVQLPQDKEFQKLVREWSR
jgi:hypothetical protein